MKKLLFLAIFSSLVFLSNAQSDDARIIIDIPSSQKPWNHINWNDSESQFQFAIVTDRTGGHRPGVFPMGIKKLNLLQPEFVMSVGDLIEGYTEDDARLNAEWKEFMGFIDSLQAPFFYVPGNHDITNAVMAEKWKELFGVSYYHFVYKDILFLCLNSEDNHRGAGRGTIDDEQFEYIEKTLQENSEVKHTMVFMHQPLWVQEDTKRWKDVEALLANRPHYVFAGHYHRYWKTNRNQGNYIALATTGGGSPLRGRAYGEFDHVVWVTMTEQGPILANLFLDGIWDENVVTNELVDLVRNKPFPVKIEPIYIEASNQENIKTTIKIINNGDNQMKVVLKGLINRSLHYELEKDDILVEPNDVQEVTLNIHNINHKALNDLQPIQVDAEITYVFEHKPDVSFSDRLHYLPFPKNTIQSSKIKLDGNLKDWKDSKWTAVTDRSGSPFNYKGSDDFSMQFATSYDQSNLYLAIKIKDDEIYTNENGSYWSQDALLIGLDPRSEH
ncbi:MAG: hypothetical protein CMB80_21010, partial [Flammeovirgaceae bacterium]|nr:hypothetical protein [Flammeovirgaceae bacterium]